MQLFEPLVTLQKHVAKLRDKYDSAAHLQLCLASAARKNGRLPIAMIALHELRTTFWCSPEALLSLTGHSGIIHLSPVIVLSVFATTFLMNFYG
jgi:hypothetical protein